LHWQGWRSGIDGEYKAIQDAGEQDGLFHYIVMAKVKQNMMATKNKIFFMLFELFAVYVVFMITLLCFDDTKMRRQTAMAKKSALLNLCFRTA